MARLPRIVLPGIPHHITQRGNRREPVFFEDGDYELYLDLLADAAAHAQVTIWSHCLMPDDVRSVAVPDDEDGPRRTGAVMSGFADSTAAPGQSASTAFLHRPVLQRNRPVMH